MEILGFKYPVILDIINSLRKTYQSQKDGKQPKNQNCKF